MKHYKHLAPLHAAQGFPAPENPLLSLVSCKGTCSNNNNEAYTCDFYRIGFKKIKSGEMIYGGTQYDHSNGTMSFVKPRQIIGSRDIELDEQGFFIYIHEDYLHGTALYTELKKYSYFDYEVNEALHLSPNEEAVMWELFHKIESEYYNTVDEFSKDIMLTHIDAILKYAQRFYKRQFINRKEIIGKTATRCNEVLLEYLESGALQSKGLPTVQFLSEKMHLSSGYLSDLLKHETGKTAMELIHIFLMSEAKNMLSGENQSIADTAYALGFENLPYFSRLFRKEVGISPSMFRKQHLN